MAKMPLSTRSPGYSQQFCLSARSLRQRAHTFLFGEVDMKRLARLQDVFDHSFLFIGGIGRRLCLPVLSTNSLETSPSYPRANFAFYGGEIAVSSGVMIIWELPIAPETELTTVVKVHRRPSPNLLPFGAPRLAGGMICTVAMRLYRRRLRVSS